MRLITIVLDCQGLGGMSGKQGLCPDQKCPDHSKWNHQPVPSYSGKVFWFSVFFFMLSGLLMGKVRLQSLGAHNTSFNLIIYHLISAVSNTIR